MIIFLIFFSGVLLALDDPFRDPESYYSKVLRTMDIIITSIYCLEALLKIVASGFIFGEKSYLKDGWNAIDFLSLIISLQSFIFNLNLSYLKGVRSIRVFKLSGRFKGLRLVLISLIKARYQILKLIIFAFSFFFVIAIIPNQYFKGKFYRCVNFDP